MSEATPDFRAEQRRTGVWRNRFLALLDRTPVPTAICQLDGTITVANPAFAEALSTRPSQLRDRHVLEFFQAKVQRDYERLVAGLHRGRARLVIAVQFPGGGGELTVQAVSDDEGSGLLITLRITPVPTDVHLSDRESEILRLIAGGATSAAVAAELGITGDGVNYHLTRMSDRFGVPNRTALVARAYSLGLLDPATWPPR
ncbi:LuxR C-terminal-related transcriptional regulator [Kutzneria sp. 744]|uniref:helix-turn-helix transcriptional regulator n=1 Tax=Kutzneria sp. (strain 744) TaxID=345341 RepID=UPI0003EECE5A|nr:LuxR C-terminal-related transcriptional regulator [Kutzneria sp. 744]EWM14239.1 LuxR-family transcriptional regulator [Kutzneria sp. 744]